MPNKKKIHKSTEIKIQHKKCLIENKTEIFSGDGQLTHITFEQLADYQDGNLITKQIAIVEEHLAADCNTCDDDLAWLNDTTATIRGYDWVTPPSGLRTSTRRSFREHFKTQRQESGLRRWYEALIAPKPSLALMGAAAMVVIVAMAFVLVVLLGQGSELTATVAQVSGSVEVQPAASRDWRPLRMGAELRAGDRIRSAAEAMALLRFPDDSIVEMGGDSQLAIMQLSSTRGGEGQIVVLHQYVGQTQFDIQPQNTTNSWFEVETSSASVTVIGTAFTVEVTHYQVTVVSVAEGTIELRGDDSAIDLAEGQVANVFPNGEPVPGLPATISGPPCVQLQEKLVQEMCTEVGAEGGSTDSSFDATAAGTSSESPLSEFPGNTSTTGITTPAIVFGQPTPSTTPMSPSGSTPTATYLPGVATPTTMAPPSSTPTQAGETAPLPTATPSPTTPPYPTWTPLPPPATPHPPTATSNPPTWTPSPPTATPFQPTATPFPPTATPPPPPTATPFPPTATPPPPPTATSPPPTSTPIPPTPTSPPPPTPTSPPPPTATSPPPPTPTPPPYP